jgi:hypothetical protein
MGGEDAGTHEWVYDFEIFGCVNYAPSFPMPNHKWSSPGFPVSKLFSYATPLQNYIMMKPMGARHGHLYPNFWSNNAPGNEKVL